MTRAIMFAVIVLGTTTLFASGTSSSGTNVGPTPNNQPNTAFTSTQTMVCLVVALKEPNLILLEDPKTGEKFPYRLASRIRLRAKNKADFDGRRKLTFADLAPGQEVKVSIAPARHEVISLKVLRNQIEDENS